MEEVDGASSTSPLGMCNPVLVSRMTTRLAAVKGVLLRFREHVGRVKIVL